ncbi:MAG: zinc-dependent peptidase, partial [Xanthomonadales bacterium]|nr:zinc-dependent peptidase [Xanthomonadales bacterium]
SSDQPVRPAPVLARGQAFLRDKRFSAVADHELSWADIVQDLEHPFDGLDVVIHEVAHKLDMLDGEMNGIPRLSQSIDRSLGIETLSAARKELANRIDRSESALIDP